jgi:predicted transcriptional regulator
VVGNTLELQFRQLGETVIPKDSLRMERRRSSVEVIADILRLGQAGKTEIMYSANMSYFQLQKYLNYLLKLELIDKVEVGNPSVTYRVTEKGLSLLKSIEGVLEILQLNEVG